MSDNAPDSETAGKPEALYGNRWMPMPAGLEWKSPFEPGKILIDRFVVISAVAEGGMGFVCEAFDRKLSERVALKCAKTGHGAHLPPEVRNAREISHPNVCKIYEIHTTPASEGGFDFISMEFLAGETLSERMRRSPVTKAEANAIARQICSGLAEAHRRGVIHGDLKSNNIILVDLGNGVLRAVITDFGLAGSTKYSEEKDSSVKIGTPEYMAPELWEGADISVATDIYALGVILWQLRWGQKRLHASADAPTITWQEASKPRPSDVKHNRILARCLHPDSAQRYGSADEVLRALGPSPRKRWALGIAASIALVTTSALVAYAVAEPKRESIKLAVLPFRTDQGLGAWGNRLFRETSQQVALLTGDEKRVVSAIPASEVVGQKVRTADQAGSVLQATHVLTVNLADAGARTHLHAELTNTRSGIPVRDWDIDYDPAELRFVGTALTGVITSALHLPHNGEPELNTSAKTSYIRGEQELRQDSTDSAALKDMSTAVQQDPDSPLTYAGLAEAQWWKHHLDQDDHWLDEAVESIRHASCRDPDTAAVKRIHGLLLKEKGLYEVAVREYQRAIELEPSNADGLRRLGQVFLASNRGSEALACFRQATQLEPNYYRTYLDLGTFEYTAGHNQEAIRCFERAVKVAPDQATARFSLGVSLIQEGRFEEAESDLRRAVLLDGTGYSLDTLAVVLLYERRDLQAIEILQRATTLAPRWSMPWVHLGMSYRHLGKGRDATRADRKALQLAEGELAQNPRDADTRSALAYICADLGQDTRAKFEINQALQTESSQANVITFAVFTYERLEQRDKTLNILHDATPAMVSDLNRWPDLANLQRDSRFLQLLNSQQARK
jgi:eukaryotic-like serine/threonine-protein kinase